MPRKVFRLFAVFSLVFVFLIYRTLESSWHVEQPIPASAKKESASAQAPSSIPVIGADEKPIAPWKEPGGGKQDPEVEGEDPDERPKLGDKPSPADPSKVHWTKAAERFPVPTESIVPLPKGPSKKIPKIQHVFSPEKEADRQKRLERQSAVKSEIQRSWAGYRRHAWMHDELRPVTNSSQDPFCGWAATLIDSLDTLWIAGLKDEFDEAADAVKTIDFTYAECSQIPVFETTIRYLGGLIAAYDVSGGASGDYVFFVDKAVELADVLMSIFDTANRMPILYYSWKEPIAFKPEKASSSVSLAELTTLSMEFTRLAHITGQHRYYDAIDRITEELVAMQERGTLIPGLFPHTLDASGCNMTATNERDRKLKAATAPTDVAAADSSHKAQERSPDSWTLRPSEDDRLERRQSVVSVVSQQEKPESAGRASSGINKREQMPQNADKEKRENACVPQGFAPATPHHQEFHMGGGQDSAYEYFGKEYLLLGGRETKYQKLYEDTIKGINQNLLYRPMVPGDWDILFPAKVTLSESQNRKVDTMHEVEHLTCFVGGMYALGGKLFGRDEDLDYAEKLTNGCVWAYQSTASGLMAERGKVMHCPTLEKCDFDKDQWGQALDPLHASRDKQVRDWEKREAERKRQEQEAGDRTVSQQKPLRPLTHKEFVDQRIKEGVPQGYVDVADSKYILRPEAIESVWYMYRITGDASWLEKGWAMFQATVRATRAPSANSAIANVLVKDKKGLINEMQSFWLAETLKYYYLLFSEPDVISLDEWVLNTEAHPFKL